MCTICFNISLFYLQSVFTRMSFTRVWEYTAIISLNWIKNLIFVMVKCGVLFEVRTEFLNNI
jgi:hypothetical protein